MNSDNKAKVYVLGLSFPGGIRWKAELACGSGKLFYKIFAI